ncbi:motile sperm domain-containing protein 2-like [Genypterus blacodes]|uniref:motile sperm domain-containing protein 2-like n=1 Tax=Genypterus blacodes TaxID=154954 RepID=UPI003F768C44
MSDSGLSNVDLDFVKYLISCFEVYYPNLLSKMIMYEIPWIINAAWKIVKTWLSPDAINKLKFVSRGDIQTYIHPEHLPSHMGGTDSFIYSYPPLPDDFQTTMSDSPNRVDDFDTKDEDAEVPTLRIRKVCFADEDEDGDDVSQVKTLWRPSTTYKGSLLHISPAEELDFGTTASQRGCLLILQNVTQTSVAYKVRTTAPEKYKVKPGNSSCAAAATVEITVNLREGFQVSPLDRFLVMAAELQSNATFSQQDLAQFWDETPQSKIMKHKLRCHILHNRFVMVNTTKGHQDLHATLLQLMACSSRLDHKLDQCVWTQNVIMVVVMVLTTLWGLTLYFYVMQFPGGIF